MKLSTKVTLLTLWLVAGTVILVSIWARHIDYVPSPPMVFSLWLSDLAGAKDADAESILDVHYMLVVSFLVLSFFTFIAMFIWKRIHKRKHER